MSDHINNAISKWSNYPHMHPPAMSYIRNDRQSPNLNNPLPSYDIKSGIHNHVASFVANPRCRWEPWSLLLDPSCFLISYPIGYSFVFAKYLGSKNLSQYICKPRNCGVTRHRVQPSRQSSLDVYDLPPIGLHQVIKLRHQRIIMLRSQPSR